MTTTCITKLSESTWKRHCIWQSTDSVKTWANELALTPLEVVLGGEMKLLSLKSVVYEALEAFWKQKQFSKSVKEKIQSCLTEVFLLT